MDEGVMGQDLWVSLETRKGKEVDSSLECPEVNIVLIFAQWDHIEPLQNCEIKNVRCFNNNNNYNKEPGINQGRQTFSPKG